MAMEVKTKLFKRQSKLDRRKGKWVLRIEYFDQVADKQRLSGNPHHLTPEIGRIDCKSGMN